MTTTSVVAEAETDALSAILEIQDMEIEDSLESLMAAEMADDTLAGLVDAEKEQSAEPEPEIDEDQILAEIELDDVKTQAYEEQGAKATDDLDPEAVTAAEAQAPVAVKKKRAVKRTSTASMAKSEAIVHKLGESRYEVCVLTNEMADMDDDTRKGAIDDFIVSIDSLPKKVGEKVLNLLCHVANEDTLSTYTDIAIQMLKDDGELTTETLRNKYLDRPYSIGTSGAQSSQMMSLLPAMGLATRSGRTLTKNPNSVLIDLL